MIVGFVLRTFGQIMGCFLNCFRVRDETTRPHLISGPAAVSSNTRHDPLVSRNRLGSLLLSDDNGRSPRQDKRVCNLESPNEKDLKDEARFLKSCGTLLETPFEMRKASEKVKDLLHHDGDAENSKFHSWLPSTSIKNLHLEEELNQGPISLVKHCEDLQEVCSGERESTSNLSKGQKLSSKKTSCGHPESSVVESSGTAKKVDYNPPLSVTSEHPIDTTRHKNKYVRFECKPDTAILTPDVQDRGQTDFQGIHNGSKRSPYPTPLKLTDEMQTPGTVYSANVGNLGNGKNARIRSQHVYHVQNPVQDFSELMVQKEEDYCAEQLDQLRESLEQSEHASPDYTPASYTGEMQVESTIGKKVNVEASLSHQVKTSSPQKTDKVQNFGTVSSGGSPSRTPGTDRPILGIVAAHWNEDELSHVSTKWWDGNGIPNSTNKYKEDQKVSWHATPFEERLEKALSNESLVHQRSRLSTEPVEFFENEERDTAGSRLQTAKHAKSVVSF